MITIRIPADEQFFQEMIFPKLKQFYFLALVPEIVDKTYEKDGRAFKELLHLPLYDL